MLKIYYGDLDADNYIFNPDVFFNNSYEDEWITDQLSVQMIKDVDKSEVIGPKVIDSPFLGSIPVERLSGGVKTLILMNNDSENIFNEMYKLYNLTDINNKVNPELKTAYKYSKTKLSDYYKAPKIIEKVKHILPEQICVP